MKLIDLNPNGGIGSNSMYLQIGPFHLLIDAGINPKLSGLEALPTFNKIPTSDMDAIILTHCHLDHLGALPLASRHFPGTPIIATPASAVLGPRMLQNSVSIMTIQRDELGIKEYPLYTRAEVERLKSVFLETPFRRTRYLEKKGEELAVTLYPAGHVAGASSVLLQYKHQKIFLTGDISFNPQWTIPAADLPEGPVDVLIMETTRGTTQRTHTREEEAERLLVALNETIGGGGSVLMPVLALGRMQEMLMFLSQAKRDGDLLEMPIFCSGLGLDLVDYYDELHRKNRQVNFSRKFIKDLRIKNIPDYVNPNKGGIRLPGLYMVSSGMVVQKTPSYAVAASLFDDPDSAIFFVGYCDESTPGGEILKLAKGDTYLFEALEYKAELRARIDRFDLSGHADREDLVKMAKDLAPRTIVLTHGDPEAREYFKGQLTAPGGVIDPTPLKVYEV